MFNRGADTCRQVSFEMGKYVTVKVSATLAQVHYRMLSAELALTPHYLQDCTVAAGNVEVVHVAHTSNHKTAAT
jgi:hypothetical protein